jgi:hypothetical protein
VQSLYQAFSQGEELALPALPVQYADYALWQRDQDLSPHLAYWREAMADYEDGLTLPYDYPRSADGVWHARTVHYRYPAALAEQFARVSREQNSTLFMGLLSSFALVLSRYTGREDVCIGTTTAGREHLELEGLIGFFVNILPLRIDLSGNPSLATLLSRVRDTTLAGFEHQALPFEYLLNALNRPRESSQTPLVPVVMRHQNFLSGSAVRHWSESISASELDTAERTTQNSWISSFTVTERVWKWWWNMLRSCSVKRVLTRW